LHEIQARRVGRNSFKKENRMLVLSRKVGETMVIDDRIKVLVKQMSRNQVRPVIDAPGEITVDRYEVWLRKQRDRPRQSPSHPK
jgi:carbon storage regulator CsrA